MTSPVILISQLHCINFTSQDGLPSDNITCATEDLDGFIWLGTASGVCQAVGSRFINCSSIGDGPNPAGAFVKSIDFDEFNNLWVATEKQGIFHLDRKKNLWENYKTDQSAPFKIPGDEVFFVHASQDGKIWYGCKNGGLGCIDFINGTNDNYLIDHLPTIGGWKNQLKSILVNRKDSSQFYVIGQGYLYEFDSNSKTFSIPKVNRFPNTSKGHRFSPQSIAYGPNNTLWLGTWSNGVKSFDLTTGQYFDIYPDNTDKSVSWRSNIHAGKNGDLWVTDTQNGISKYQNDHPLWSHYRPEAFNRNGLLSGTYNGIFTASNDDVWVLTSNGVSLIVPKLQAFKYFDDDVEKTNFFLDINPIPNENKYIAAFAGENGPLKILDNDFNILSTSYFQSGKNPFQSISKLIPYGQDFICVTDRLLIYNVQKKELIPFEAPGFRQKGAVYDLLIDHQNNFWILVGNGAIVKYNPADRSVHEYLFEGYKGVGRDKIIYHTMAFVGENLWVAANAELIFFNTTNEEFQYYYSDGKNLKRRKSSEALDSRPGTINQVLPIASQEAWVVTSGEGIYHVKQSDKDGMQIIDRRNNENLDQLQTPVEMIRGKDDDYWIATRNGLVHADNELNNYTVFGQREGLRYGKLSQGISRIGDQLFVGMPKGFTKMNTKKILSKTSRATCEIMNATLDGFDVLDKTHDAFNYKQNNFIVSVATPIYHEARSVRYAHRLNNHSDQWNYSNFDEYIFRYENLDPGEYTFKVKASAPSSEWSELSEITFKINPPFWKTNWFRLLLFLAFLGLFYLIYQLKLNADLRQASVKTKLAELENQALRAQMNPHFIFNSLNSIKSLILLDRKQEGITYLTKFSKMVREILNVSKQPTIPLEKELELLRIYLDMESLRFHQKFEYNLVIDPSVNLYKQKVPPLIIQPYAENSIWHGLLHKEGDAHLSIRILETDQHLVISIEDNGIGRDASNEIKANKTRYKKSSEGMKLSKNRIDLVDENAEISVEDIFENGRPAGTKVIIKLPKSND